MSELPVVKVSNVYIEDIFAWLYDSVLSACGDGGGTLVCQNYVEAYLWFREWIGEARTALFPLHKEVREHHCIYWHDNNESFLFTDVMPTAGFEDEYIFVIESTCLGYPINRKKRQWELKPV